MVDRRDAAPFKEGNKTQVGWLWIPILFLAKDFFSISVTYLEGTLLQVYSFYKAKESPRPFGRAVLATLTLHSEDPRACLRGLIKQTLV